MLSGFFPYLRIGGVSLLLSLVAACGGGGGGGGNGGFINPPDGGGNDVPTYSLSIEAVDQNGEASLELTSQQPLVINVTVTSSDGSVPSNEIVQLTTTVADIDPANGSSVTDTNGVASFTLNFNGTEGAGSVVASFTANSTTVEASINIESILIREEFVLTLDTSNSEGLDSNTFSALSPLTATLTLTEADGETPVEDALLSLSSTIGTISPELGTALTDDMGIATFTVNFSDIEGAGVLIGAYESDTLSLSVQKNIESIASSDAYSLVIGDIPNDGVITSAEPVAGSVQLISADTNQYPIANQIIEVSSDLVDVLPSNQRVRTDELGVADFSMLFKGIVGAGELAASYSSASGAAAAITAIETQLATPEPVPGVVTSLALSTRTLEGSSSRELSSVQPLSAEVRLLDAFGDVVAISGQIVELSSDVAIISPENGASVTDSGIAMFGLEFSGVIGAGKIDASMTVDGTTFIGSAAIQSVSEIPYLINLERTDGDLSVVNPLEITATLLSLSGNPVEDAVLSFDTSLASVSPSSAVTNEAGQTMATVEFTGEVGAAILTATYEVDGEVFSNSLNFNSVAVDPPFEISLSLESGGIDVSQSGRFSDLEALNVVATLEDDMGQPVSGERVALTTSIGAVSAPANAEAVTTASGEAVFTVSSDGENGAGTLIATFESEFGVVTASKNIQAVTADSVYSLEITSVSADGVIQQGQPITVSATLMSSDEVNFPTRFQNINAETTIGNIAADGGTFSSSTSGRTNSTGQVSFTVAYGGVVGSGTVTLSYADAPNGDASDSANVVVQNPLLDLNLVVNAANSSGVTTRQFDSDNPLIIGVNVVADDGSMLPIDNVPVLIETTIGRIDGASSALVQNGSASFVIVFDGAVGAGEVTATYGEQAPLLQQTLAIEAVAAEPYTISLTSSGGNLSASNSLELMAVVTRGGVPVTSEVVSFATSIGSLSADSSVTNVTGEAVVTLSADGSVGAGTVTATINTDIGAFTASMNVQAIAEPISYALAITSLTELDGTTSNNSLSEQTPLLVTIDLVEGMVGLENRVIVLETDTTLATISPDNGAALTNANGQATFQLTYAGTTGAGTLLARYDGVAGTVSDEESFETVITPLEIGSLDDNGDFIDGALRVEPSSNIGYQGSAELLIAIGDSAGQRVVSTQSVRLESACLLNGFSSLNSGSVIELTDGVGSTTYTAGDACSGVSDEITATLIQAGNNNPATASVTLDISAAPAADERFLTFVSATPSTIALAGTGGGSSLEERAQVVFEVRDGSGNPVAGQQVDFELSRAVGGVQLSDTNAVTDANGQVAATVISGSVATPVRVIATTERSPADAVANLVSVISDSLTISSGIVTQARFALSADVLNPAAAAVVDGTSISLIVSAFDRFGNAVPNGTAVSFTSECGGLVNTAQSGLPVGSCEIIDGGCTIEWRAQPAAATVCPDNRVTIMAHALGEEAFVDSNANGFFDTGETFTDNSEAFRDDNESTSYELGEFFIDLDNDGTFAVATPVANAPAGLFNGVACNSDGTVCSDELISVYANLEIVAGPQDASALQISVEDAGGTPLTEGVDPMDPGSYIVLVSDLDGNLPPLGTEVSAEGTGECEAVSPPASTPNSSEVASFAAGVSVIASGPNDADTDDRITVNVTIPTSVGGSGNTQTLSFACNP